MTGEAASDEPAAPAPTLDRPILVWVSAGVEGFDKLGEVVFKKENVALGTKAFRAVRMSPEDVENDPLVSGKGTDDPRILVIDADRDVLVLEKGKLSSGGVWNAMKKVASSFYENDLDDVVKEHLKLLTELDKAAKEESALADKEARLAEEAGAKVKKELEEVRAAREEAKARLDELTKRQVSIWKLTAKTAKSS